MVVNFVTMSPQHAHLAFGRRQLALIIGSSIGSSIGSAWCTQQPIAAKL